LEGIGGASGGTPIGIVGPLVDPEEFESPTELAEYVD
jgi:hypothetical protein